MISTKELADRIATVSNLAAVFQSDLSAAVAQPAVDAAGAPAPVVTTIEKSARDKAIDGVAYHVFNSLRGTDDTVDGATFDDVRAIVVEYF